VAKTVFGTPIKRIIAELRKRDIKISQLRALEVFGGSGDGHLVDYAGLVKSLEIWEINPSLERTLEQRFPRAVVKITNTFEEVRRTNSIYDFIVIDNPMSTYGCYCEHFDLFPSVFRIAADSCVMLVDIIPEASESARKMYPYLMNEEQVRRRREFYGAEHPEKISIPELLKTYRRLASDSGFTLDWHVAVRRDPIAHYALNGFFSQMQGLMWYLAFSVRRVA
jgi:hypothetical protein